MIKNITVNGVTKTISNAELHVEEENEKEGVLVFNGEVFGENIEQISHIKIGDKFYALNVANFDEKIQAYLDANYENGNEGAY